MLIAVKQGINWHVYSWNGTTFVATGQMSQATGNITEAGVASEHIYDNWQAVHNIDISTFGGTDVVNSGNFDSGSTNIAVEDFEGNTQNIPVDIGGFGSAGLDYSQLEGHTPEEVFNILQEQGFIGSDQIWDDDWEADMLNLPIFEGVSAEDAAALDAEVAEDVYGFETEIARAEEDKITAQSAYGLAQTRGAEDIAKSQERLGMDLGVTGTAARSDIYGLQSQGAQSRREGMFGKGMGGGMQALRGQDISSGMQQVGGARMGLLGATTRGLRQGATDYQGGITRGIADAGITRDAALLGYNRDISDATADLYGVAGTGEYEGQMVGGIYGEVGGSEAYDQYQLLDSAQDDWESDMREWLSSNIEEG